MAADRPALPAQHFVLDEVDDVRSGRFHAAHPVDESSEANAHGASGEALGGKGFTYFDGDQPFPTSADGMNDVYRDSLWTDANRLVGLDLPAALLGRAPTG